MNKKKFLVGFSIIAILSSILFIGNYLRKNVFFPDKELIVEKFMDSFVKNSYVGYYNSEEYELSDFSSKKEINGAFEISNTGTMHFAGNLVDRISNEEGCNKKDIELYGDMTKNILYLKDENWSSYSGLDKAFSSSWWEKELKTFSYEGRKKTPSGKRAHLLSCVYGGAELSNLITKLHVFPQAKPNTSDVYGQLYVYCDIYTMEPVELIFVIKAPNEPMSLYYPNETKNIVSYECELIFNKKKDLNVEIPSSIVGSKNYPIESLLGEMDDSGRPSATIEKDGIKAGFIPYDLYTEQTVSNNVLTVVPEDSLRGNPTIKMEVKKYKDVYMDVEKNRNLAIEFFNKNGYKESFVSEVTQTFVMNKSRYYYSQMYVDEKDGFQHIDYIINVDMGNGKCVELKYTMESGFGENCVLSTKDLFKVINHIWVGEANE